MTITICCREMGIDCAFVIEEESGETAVQQLMQHVQTVHTEDWFEIEEIYQAACSVARAKAA